MKNNHSPQQSPDNTANHNATLSIQKITRPEKDRFLICRLLLMVFSLSNIVSPVQAQVSADGTVGTKVNTNNNVAEISGGTTKGENLFHSFREFSISAGDTAFFNNGVEIDNIIGRVTGSSISNIDGLIRANGNSNLILINSNGINFGANARLSIGGSFLGSTAESIIFEDGTAFRTADTDLAPLLTVSAPVGLQLGQNAGAINILGEGHNFSQAVPVFAAFNREQVNGLKLQTGKTLGLVGGDVSLAGGVLSSEMGRVELGSVGEGIVGLDFGDRNLSLSYANVSAFKDINLEQRSLVDASGFSSGSIQIQGNNLTFKDGSLAFIQNAGNETSGNLEVNAAESISLQGTNENGVISSGFVTESLAQGKGGDAIVKTPKLEAIGGASIVALSVGSAPPSNVRLEIANSLKIDGFSQINPNNFTTLSSLAYGQGDAGSVEVETKNLTIFNGGNIASLTGGLGTGSGGNVSVNASESIELNGVNPIAFAPSQVTAGSGGRGNAGNVALQTKNLIVKNGGRVGASATAAGNAGSLTINATESIMVTGTVPGSLNPSLIVASANILDPQLRQLFGLPDVPSGNAGNVTINTPQLRIMDGGQITARNDGTGDAGNIQIKSDAINLNSDGGITAAVESGKGGTINLEVADSLNLTSGGQIASDNRGAGDGGEITIAANSLNISDRSFITTTTFGAGTGGNIILNIAESIKIKGTGLEQLQQTFLANALNGTLQPGTRGTGIFIGTAADGVGGNLEIATNSLSLMAGGIIFGPIFESGTGGSLDIKANDITIAGSALQIGAGLNSVDGSRAGDIFIDTQRLTLQDGGLIINATFGDATGGEIEIQATDFINFQDTPSGFPLFTGVYANTSRGSGDGGNINLKSKNILIDDALISTTTGAFINNGLDIAGGGNAGNISIAATDNIKLAGIRTPDDPRFASGISSNSFTGGRAGNIEISSRELLIQDGSEIAALTLGSGSGGNITIDATDSIDIVGKTTVKNMLRGGLIATSGSPAFPQLQGSGSSGSIAITAGNLSIERGGSIDVQSLGIGSAGNLDIKIDKTISLDNEGTLSAATNAGTGGNIKIEAGNIFWRGNSTTTAKARGNADGGNINIQGRNLVVLESSELTANANTGRGGNIDIDAQGLFICNECIVSASSRLGIDGVVDIDTLEPNSNLEIVEVPIKLTQPNETVAQACSVEQKPNNSKLTISGRGGLPTRPSEALNSESIVSVGVPQKQGQTGKSTVKKTQLPTPAHNWYVDSKGVVVLTAQSAATTNNSQYNSPDCHVR